MVQKREGAIGRAFVQWSRIYGAFIRARFVKFSRGGGNWKRLAPSTLKARRKGRGRGSAAILRDTGLLFAALNPEVMQLKQTTSGLVSTFGGSGKYPNGTTVADVMSFHQTGGPNLPKRLILVGPDDKTQRLMREVMDRAVREEARKV